MDSIEIKVPRNLIKKFYPHPEPYGDGYYVVDLINGMYTDVFYRRAGDFVTITNNNDLIAYLEHNDKKPREYFYVNGVNSFRAIEDFDKECIDQWSFNKPISVEIQIPKVHKIPKEFMVCFYWIEVGYAKIEDRIMTLRVYEKHLIKMKDIRVAIASIIESIKISS